MLDKVRDRVFGVEHFYISLLFPFVIYIDDCLHSIFFLNDIVKVAAALASVQIDNLIEVFDGGSQFGNAGVNRKRSGSGSSVEGLDVGRVKDQGFVAGGD